MCTLKWHGALMGSLRGYAAGLIQHANWQKMQEINLKIGDFLALFSHYNKSGVKK